MSDFRIDKITNRDGSTGTQICGVSTFSGTSGMVMPGGPTAYRGGRGRAIIGGGNTPTDVNILDKVEIATTGNASDFGDLSQVREQPYAASSSTRGVWAGGKTTTTMDYVTLSSEGGANRFGDLTQTAHSGKGVSDGTTAVWMGGKWDGGYYGPMRMEFTIFTSDGSASYFGDIADGKVFSQTGAFASPTRGVIGGGAGRFSPYYQNNIDYITIATKGDTKDFGDTSALRTATGGCASPTRGLFMGGQVPGGHSDVIDYVTIASLGNATDFGNLTVARAQTDGGSSHTRGFCPGGEASPGIVNTIDYVTIATTGNAADFGDLTGVRRFTGTASDCHGGLA